MSEFACKNGHLMTGRSCQLCGEPVHTMDGLTDDQHRGIERGDLNDVEFFNEEEEDVS